MGKRAACPKAQPSKKTKAPANEEESSSVRTPMEKAEVSKMLGYLKYWAKPSLKNPEASADAQKALEVYKNLANEQKAGFLESYHKHKGNLKWVYAFEQVEEEVVDTKAGGTQEGWEGWGVWVGGFTAPLVPPPPPLHSLSPNR